MYDKTSVWKKQCPERACKHSQDNKNNGETRYKPQCVYKYPGPRATGNKRHVARHNRERAGRQKHKEARHKGRNYKREI